jgi:hypothetical protein
VQIPLECLAAKSLVSADGARSASTQSSLGAVCAWFNARMRISANHLVNETVAKCEQDILDVTRDMKVFALTKSDRHFRLTTYY